MAHYTQPTDYVFTSSSGRPANPDMLRETLQSVLRDRIKDKITTTLGPREDGLHLLRHTSTSMVYQETCNIKEAQECAGHSSPNITMGVYTHLLKKSQQETAKRVFQRPTIPAPSGQEN